MKILKNKKYLLFLFIILILFILILGIFKINNNKNIETEMQPEEEISEEQYRQTMVLLYFINSKTGEIENETRLVDVKILINNPYETLINMLIDGAKKENLFSYIPKNTKINKIELKNNILIIEFSNEFLEINNSKNKEKIINIIEKTLKELLEINNIEIICNGEIIK